MTSRMLEIETLLKDTYIKFFSRIMVADMSTAQETLSSIHFLTAIFKQNESLFTKY